MCLVVWTVFFYCNVMSLFFVFCVYLIVCVLICVVSLCCFKCLLDHVCMSARQTRSFFD